MLDYNSNNLGGVTPGITAAGIVGSIKREYSKARLLTTPRSERGGAAAAAV